MGEEVQLMGISGHLRLGGSRKKASEYRQGIKSGREYTVGGRE